MIASPEAAEHWPGEILAVATDNLARLSTRIERDPTSVLKQRALPKKLRDRFRERTDRLERAALEHAVEELDVEMLFERQHEVHGG